MNKRKWENVLCGKTKNLSILWKKLKRTGLEDANIVKDHWLE
ncbi:hypothetical protein RO1_36190 [Roseburia intestinalis XB6B4]|uniref:Uncharacterized protein n=1 Tax=Roseburia intestinalis XB6B4 TaxID=718255 RepID=D4L2N2_9FIRM|nr:hypothetical protein RO1_36190 [Roseburia intestinalis XB6B4]